MNRHLVVQSITQVLVTEQNVHVCLVVLAAASVVDAKQSIAESVKVFLILALNHVLKAELFLTGIVLLFQMVIKNQKILSLFALSLRTNGSMAHWKEEVRSSLHEHNP